jgi:site-specific DNA-cytosine methylase
MTNPPRLFLVENVKNFEVSATREELVRTLQSRGYTFQEFLLSPEQLGMPNSRLRYYMVASLTESLPVAPSGTVLERLPVGYVVNRPGWISAVSSTGATSSTHNAADAVTTSQSTSSVTAVYGDADDAVATSQSTSSVTAVYGDADDANGTDDANGAASTPDRGQPVRYSHIPPIPMTNFLDKCFVADPAAAAEYMLPERMLCRFGRVLDVVTPTSRRSMCFTKAYGSFAEGTGSVVQTVFFAPASQSAIFHRHEEWAGWGDKCQCADCYATRAAKPASREAPVARASLATGVAEAAAAHGVGSRFESPPEAGAAADSGSGGGGGSGSGCGGDTVKSVEEQPQVKQVKAVRPVHKGGACPMLQLRMRYFSPAEIARLMGFPAELSFPDSITVRFCFRRLFHVVLVYVASLSRAYSVLGTFSNAMVFLTDSVPPSLTLTIRDALFGLVRLVFGGGNAFLFTKNHQTKQAWKLLGNSLNVHVVAVLLSNLIPSEIPSKHALRG